MNPWCIAFLIVSALAAIITIYDKIVAGKGRRRVPEQTLFLIALSGGAAAMYFTMLIIRHKTCHKRFMLGLPLILLIHSILYLLLK